MADTTTAETTPLLSGGEDNEAQAAPATTEQDPTQIPASARFPRTVKFFTTTSFTVSIVALILLIATAILVRVAPFGWYVWRTTDAIYQLSWLVFIALIFSLINLRWKWPIAVNVILDILLAFFILVVATDLEVMGWPDDGWCYDNGYRPKPIQPACLKWKLAAAIMVGFCIGFAGIVGLAHLILVVVRCVAAFKSRVWRTPFPWTIPAGRISFEFSIKLWRQGSEGGNSHEEDRREEGN